MLQQDFSSFLMMFIISVYCDEIRQFRSSPLTLMAFSTANMGFPALLVNASIQLGLFHAMMEYK